MKWNVAKVSRYPKIKEWTSQAFHGGIPVGCEIPGASCPRSLNVPVMVRGIVRGRAMEEKAGLEHEYDHDGTTTSAQ
jgi:hypothetical protein